MNLCSINLYMYTYVVYPFYCISCYLSQSDKISIMVGDRILFTLEAIHLDPKSGRTETKKKEKT